MDQMPMCNVEEIVRSDKPTKNYHQLCCSPQLCRAFKAPLSCCFGFKFSSRWFLAVNSEKV